MPELPEVETIARILRPALVGRTILAAQVEWARTLVEPGAPEFCARIAGQVVQDTGRRAKFLALRLSHDWLVLHLRMSGDLVIRPADAAPAVHDRILLRLDDATTLAFNDTRKFGRAWLVDDPALVFAGLGPEPLTDEFTPAWLDENLRRRRRALKPLLLDQHFLAGLGNIYADESLHLAGLHPLTLSDSLSASQVEGLWRAIRETLQEGIRRNGASIDWVYRGGDFQNYFRVYQRAGLPCVACGTPVEKIVVGQRGTHFCPRCQALGRK